MGLAGYLDAKAVAKKLRISVSAVHGLRERGTLPSEWMGSVRVWKEETINRYLNDVAAQKRRGPKGQLTLDGLELTTDEAIAHMRSVEAQAPAGFDPAGRRRGGAK